MLQLLSWIWIICKLYHLVHMTYILPLMRGEISCDMISKNETGASQCKGISMLGRHLSIGIPIIKIRRSHDRLIFIIGIPIPGTAVFIRRWGPGRLPRTSKQRIAYRSIDKLLNQYTCFLPVNERWITCIMKSICLRTLTKDGEWRKCYRVSYELPQKRARKWSCSRAGVTEPQWWMMIHQHRFR